MRLEDSDNDIDDLEETFTGFPWSENNLKSRDSGERGM